MLIPEISESIINQLQTDFYKRVDGFFVINKPAGVTSHDIVDDVRKILRTRKVGHAGALDPFATGVLIVLVGKYTRYTEALIAEDKSYLADVVLGKSTTTQDPEGEVTVVADDKQLKAFWELDLDGNSMTAVLKKNFEPGYAQLVPLFSSVKIGGMKLRVLARKAKSVERLSAGKYKLQLHDATGNLEEVLVDLPSREVRISGLECSQITKWTDEQGASYPLLKVAVSCSKGTYIRQFAEDIGNLYNLPAFLTGLQRTSVGRYKLSSAITIEQLYDYAKLEKLHKPEDEPLRLKALQLEASSAA